VLDLLPVYFFLGLSRGVAGLCGAAVPTAHAMIADVIEPEFRAKYMGGIGAATGLGFILGPAFGGLLGSIDHNLTTFARIPCFVAASISFSNFVIGTIFIKETRKPQTKKARQNFFRRYRVALNKNYVLMFLINFFRQAGFVGVEVGFSLFFSSNFSLGTIGLGLVFAAFGVVMVLTQPTIGPLKNRFGEKIISLVSLVMLTLFFVFFSFINDIIFSFVLVFFIAFFNGLLNPILPAILSMISSAETQGLLLGIFQSFSSLARAIMPALVGTAFDIEPSYAFFLSAILFFIAFVLLIFVRVKPLQSTTFEEDIDLQDVNEEEDKEDDYF